MTISLDDIDKMIADWRPPPDPFNGATTLVLAPDAFAEMQQVLEQWARNPLMGRCPEIEVRPTLPEGCGYGFRAWREGDDPDLPGIPVVTWILKPKDAAATSPPQPPATAGEDKRG